MSEGRVCAGRRTEDSGEARDGEQGEKGTDMGNTCVQGLTVLQLFGAPNAQVPALVS